MVDWFIDVPHLIKCTRNHFLHHKIAQFAGHTVYHMFYQRVFEHQRLLGLKLVPKLKLAHIWPSTWQRMTVSLATQLYSKHMAMALKFLREDKKTAHLFNGSEATEKLTKLINDTFDILNGRHKGESINGNNWNNLVEMEGKLTKGKKICTRRHAKNNRVN
ncbi:hypothetical protein OUZ56_032084 [Daphnia magna]|uniref:Transposable element P transposase-like GTP-binding insertion domain-containing protein n=1 Tax=Daphnia magna TaxID=35525 RepID=A0ABQ9ZW33_9CRUS|nr:hypothetical protein OUZ56_032084 [Daphnia magna]